MITINTPHASSSTRQSVTRRVTRGGAVRQQNSLSSWSSASRSTTDWNVKNVTESLLRSNIHKRLHEVALYSSQWRPHYIRSHTVNQNMLSSLFPEVWSSFLSNFTLSRVFKLLSEVQSFCSQTFWWWILFLQFFNAATTNLCAGCWRVALVRPAETSGAASKCWYRRNGRWDDRTGWETSTKPVAPI